MLLFLILLRESLAKELQHCVCECCMCVVGEEGGRREGGTEGERERGWCVWVRMCVVCCGCVDAGCGGMVNEKSVGDE